MEPGEIAAEIMMVPMLKRSAEKYHVQAAKHRARAEQETKEANQKLYRAKAAGQWAICKNLGQRNAAPLTALRRKRTGPKGQPKGSIATAPGEVDEILRESLDKIYKGNTNNPEEKADEYMKKYTRYIYIPEKAANMERL